MSMMKAVILLALMASSEVRAGSEAVLPVPKKVVRKDGVVALPTKIQADEKFREQGAAFAMALKAMTGKSPTLSAGEGAILMSTKEGMGDEGYEVVVGEKVTLSATTTTGMAHATATVLQLLNQGGKGEWSIPAIEIKDNPDFGFRCFLIDMGRNPHSPDTIRRVVDMMWLTKTNILHLHLMDDQLFSFPSKAFPKLLSGNAGWTLEDWHAMEAYSQARGVTIMPEFEVPGHSTILRREYPEVFGKTPTDLATTEAAFEGITTILKEVMDVFKASPYIHIGGDEAYGVKEEYQRALINRLNKFLKSHGRKTVVWEGPRPGTGDSKVDEDVIHMNWRAHEFPPTEMLKAGHTIVNATWDPLYIVDHYPRTMFTAVCSEQCYNFNIKRFKHVNHGFGTYSNPTLIESTEKVLGFCMPWWEGREENIFPICRQRLSAVNARTWNSKGETSFESFIERDKKAKAMLETIRPWKGAKPTGGWADRMEEATEGNMAHGKKVTVSAGASQPLFHPQRLTNGATDRFDHFLGYPTKPKALEIVIDLGDLKMMSRIEVFEAAVGGSWEKYEVSVSADGEKFAPLGKTEKGSRGDSNKVSFEFESQKARFVKLSTEGCEDLTFPSFSRLCEVMVFEK